MTAPTGPDSDRTGSGNGQEQAGEHGDCGLCYSDQRCPGYCGAEGVGALYDRPAPQQPPAQEREVCPPDADAPCIGPHCARCHPAPPSEADSAGEDEVARIVGDVLLASTQSAWAELGIGPREWGRQAARQLSAAGLLAASSGVRGGDGEARERLADAWAEGYLAGRFDTGVRSNPYERTDGGVR